MRIKSIFFTLLIALAVLIPAAAGLKAPLKAQFKAPLKSGPPLAHQLVNDWANLQGWTGKQQNGSCH